MRNVEGVQAYDDLKREQVASLENVSQSEEEVLEHAFMIAQRWEVLGNE